MIVRTMLTGLVVLWATHFTSSALAAMSDEEAQQKIAPFTSSFVQAEKAGDAAAAAAHFTQDGIRVGPRGITNGLSAIKTEYVQTYKVFKEEEDTVEVVKAMDDCVILVSGKWRGKLRETVDLHGYYSFLAVCDGATWKIKADMYSYAPDGMPPAPVKQ